MCQMLGDSDCVYNSFGGGSADNFEGDGSVGSVVVGAVFVTGSFAKRSGYVGRR